MQRELEWKQWIHCISISICWRLVIRSKKKSKKKKQTKTKPKTKKKKITLQLNNSIDHSQRTCDYFQEKEVQVNHHEELSEQRLQPQPSKYLFIQ